MVKKRKKRLSRFLIISSSLFVLVLFSLASIHLVHGENPLTHYTYMIIWPKPDSGKPNLQLYTGIPIPIPAQNPQNNPQSSPNNGPLLQDDALIPQGSTGYCADTIAVACPKPASGCIHGQYDLDLLDYSTYFPGLGKGYCADWPLPGDPKTLGPGVPPPGCEAYCIAKPVVYLYPPQTTNMSVSVVAPGSVVVSDPQYPENGWKDVLAHPDGTILYNNKKYSELFYETSLTKKVPEPVKGIVMTSADIESILRKTTTQFGLNNQEQKEFLNYWVPRLQSLHSPYIFFSILDPKTKESLDKLVISPEPETRIELIAYFKPLQTPILVPPLSLPDQAPARIGFTEVEWGGTIAN